MIQIKRTSEFSSACPEFEGLALVAKLSNSAYDEKLWNVIISYSEEYKKNYTTDTLKYNPAIEATRLAYKKTGKDPNRYRPSAESLGRRICKGLSLYQVNTLVDIINLVSLQTGISIGGFDLDRIEGNALELGIGKDNEPYDAIGRGLLNILGMPVYRDNIGGIGTPTSDNERTKLSIETNRLLVILNGYDGLASINAAEPMLKDYLSEFCKTTNYQTFRF